MRLRALNGFATAAVLLVSAACSGGSSGSTTATVSQLSPPPSETPSSTEDEAPQASVLFETEQSTSRFLTMATFGPTTDEVSALVGTSSSEWLQEEFSKTPSPYLSDVQTYYELGSPQQGMIADAFDQGATTFVFWRNAVHGDDQLRQRMIFALSQILVVSNGSGGLNGIFPQTVGYYLDVLSEHAFGNYRDLLEAVTYTPAMAEYLTYLGNEKGDPETGRVPDENYAREILQLFTIGLVELEADGSVRVDASGNPIELYDNRDITELAKVFTGLIGQQVELERAPRAERFPQIRQSVQLPLTMDESRHSPLEKSFLDTTIPAGTPGDESIDLALDHIMAHPNVGPFIGRQLIQRFVTSNPSPGYIFRVADAFDAGSYTLPDGSVVGEGRKGDLKATIAAVLFDADAHVDAAFSDDQFGKVREPTIRLVHFARAFNADMSHPEYVRAIYDTSPISALAQHPFRSPSVFNFYRPGYVAPGTESGELGLTVPELQIVNASTTPGYINLLSFGAFQRQRESFRQIAPIFSIFQAPFNETLAQDAFVPDYSQALEVADDSEALVDYLDQLLLYGSMTSDTKRELVATLDTYPQAALQSQDQREDLIAFAVVLVMSSPDYLIQR